MKCFVISPIGEEGSATREHADEVFTYIIEPALATFQIEPIRSDHMSEPGKISDQMYRAIFGYDLCIAVLTFANPNVYYELAIAQSACRPVVILIQKGNALPFDVKDMRCLEYDLSITSYNKKTHITKLTRFLDQLKQNRWKGDDIFGSYRPSQPAQEARISDTLPLEFSRLLVNAKEVWITGVHRSEFLLAQSEHLERAIAGGTRFHFLFMKPNGSAIQMAAFRFPSVDDPSLDAKRAALEDEKVLQSIATVSRLGRLTKSGYVDLRLVDFLLPYGIILIDPDSPASVVFIEHYTFRTRGGQKKPKTEHLAGSQWHSLVTAEMKELWNSATPHLRSENASA